MLLLAIDTSSAVGSVAVLRDAQLLAAVSSESEETHSSRLFRQLKILLEEQGLTMPAAALLLSPMTDLTVTGSSYAGKAHADPAISAQAIRTRAADYLAGTDPADPLVSPIFADLSGLPPLLIQAGSHEVLLDDATRLAAKAAADDVAVILERTERIEHHQVADVQVGCSRIEAKLHAQRVTPVFCQAGAQVIFDVDLHRPLTQALEELRAPQLTGFWLK